MIYSSREELEAIRTFMESEDEVERQAAVERLARAQESFIEKLRGPAAPRGFVRELLLPGVIVMALVVTLILSFLYAQETRRTADKVQTIQLSQVLDNRAGCDRTNTRNASRKRRLQIEIPILRRVGFEALAAAADREYDLLVSAAAEFPLRPGSVQLNCRAAYPLP